MEQDKNWEYLEGLLGRNVNGLSDARSSVMGRLIVEAGRRDTTTVVGHDANGGRTGMGFASVTYTYYYQIRNGCTPLPHSQTKTRQNRAFGHF